MDCSYRNLDRVSASAQAPDLTVIRGDPAFEKAFEKFETRFLQ
jgi:hypothetical protein